MERLTIRNNVGLDVLKSPVVCGRCGEVDYSPITESGEDVAKRLAAYEDTGLEPEDFKKAFNEDAVVKLAAQALGTTPDRLRELVKAQHEGLLVVLEGITTGQANTIMGMCEQLNAMKARHGDDQEPLITWQLYNALTKSFARAEAEAARRKEKHG
jgi:hypothetical protein